MKLLGTRNLLSPFEGGIKERHCHSYYFNKKEIINYTSRFYVNFHTHVIVSKQIDVGKLKTIGIKDRKI